MVTIVPILACLAAVLAAAIDVLRAPRPRTVALVADRLLRWLFVFPVGLMGLWGFLGHVFFPAESAAAIGWAPSPFQYEVGMANLALGALGLGAAFAGTGFRLAATLAALCFLGGAGVGHIIDIMRTGNLAPGNAGPILYTDLLVPTALLVLLALARWGGRA